MIDMMRLVNKVAIVRPPPLLSLLWRYPRHQRYLTRTSKLIPGILLAIPPLADAPPPNTWTTYRAIRTVSDMTVIAVGPPGQPPTAVLKLPHTDEAAASLRQQSTVLAALRADPRLGDWSALLPMLLAEGEIAGQAYVVERVMPGLGGQALLLDPAARLRMEAAAVAAIGELHRRTATSLAVDARKLDCWVDQPLHFIRRWNATLPRAARNDAAIERLAVELQSALAGRSLTVSWIHGDFWPGNLLMTPDGSTLTGLVDWDLAVPDGLPLLDLLLLLLSTRSLVQRRELGDVMRALLNGGGWTPHEQALVDTVQLALPGEAVEMRAMVLLCWLWHVAAGLAKSTDYASRWLWATKNIANVLYWV